MGSGPSRHTIWENFSEPEALHYAQWQAVAFRLPAAQQEALGWWEAPPWICRLHPEDFLPHTHASGTKDFQTEGGENPGLSPCAVGLHRKVRGTNRSAL